MPDQPTLLGSTPRTFRITGSNIVPPPMACRALVALNIRSQTVACTSITQRVSESVSLMWGLRICVCNPFPGNVPNLRKTGVLLLLFHTSLCAHLGFLTHLRGLYSLCSYTLESFCLKLFFFPQFQLLFFL